jgi:outer membrane lipoprotein
VGNLGGIFMQQYICPRSFLRFVPLVAAVSWRTPFVLCVVLVTGCATPLPKGQVSDISIPELQSGQAETGLAVRWGGSIVSVLNKPDVTVLEIVSRPLWKTGRPILSDESDGRFVAEIAGFVDPELLPDGTDISLVGTVQEVRPGLIGEATYPFPVMAVFQYKLWKPRKGFTSDDFAHKHFFDRYWNDWPFHDLADRHDHDHLLRTY